MDEGAAILLPSRKTREQRYYLDRANKKKTKKEATRHYRTAVVTG
jgi:hypothetical protein